MNINEKIRDLRASKSISQEYMANQLGIDTSSYHRLERGVSPLSVNRLEQIAKVLEMDIVSIITFGNKTNVEETPQNSNYIKHLEEEVKFLRFQLQERLSALNASQHQMLPRNSYPARRV
jgi:transcriptional regulator with XRE-family HTH domain